ncbi:hypothetical protein PAMC26510_23385 [Caballeronia sordidicola]|uniref:Uncharacterized protein n=1 Tax=Caballeronia sordidicola TaxID=196367 RepID=A0A242MKS5_CABSO|nr:hypothetical protein PAMC26510_23385 [Caballeronia sordidicola]
MKNPIAKLANKATSGCRANKFHIMKLSPRLNIDLQRLKKAHHSN